MFNHFAGDGQWFGNQQIEDAGVVARCRAAFESVWAPATVFGVGDAVSVVAPAGELRHH
ncbi:DUF6879 family protein [Nocardia sp. NPDC052278]|uniref:DUF6879 family protein n=1 Tax=unclassified Nocardia TaxID=2637762 RepID=UPI00367A63BA